MAMEMAFQALTPCQLWIYSLVHCLQQPAISRLEITPDSTKEGNLTLNNWVTALC
jgi:hypothetical protein